MRHLIQICNLATGSKVVSWTGALNSQVSGSDRPANYRLRNHCVVRIYPQVASLTRVGIWIKLIRICVKALTHVQTGLVNPDSNSHPDVVETGLSAYM